MTVNEQIRPKIDQQLQERMINTIRTLSIDAVQKANSGHPGAPLGMAPMGYTLFTQFLRFNPRQPDWPNRDRFILSAGHASMLLYSLLYLTGYDLSLDDLKQFRQWGSKTPGHPEYRITKGVETSTGPLGQGFVNGVGMAIAEASLAAHFNRPGFEIVDHYTYCICSDGDLQEGITAEAASLAGHLKLGKMIYLYDANKVQLSGPADVSFTENVAERFDAYGWHTQHVRDGNDVEAIAQAVERAKGVTDRPSFIAVHAVIGFGSPLAGTYKVHGEPLGPEGVAATKKALGWPEDKFFYVPDDALDEFRTAVSRGQQLEDEWTELFKRWAAQYPLLKSEWDAAKAWSLVDGWDKDMPEWAPDPSGISTREAGGKAMNVIAQNVPYFLGGDADLSPSTKNNLIGLGDFQPDERTGRNIHFGVREHAMGSIVNGMVAHGMVRAFGATFFAFNDYQKPSVRLAAIMEIPSIFLYTHDSILLGEDGPTHQPIEQLAALRATPSVVVLRPADANESADAWRWTMEHWHLPIAMVMSRQKTPVLDRSRRKGEMSQGAYILEDAEGGTPDIILMGTGTEVALLVEAREQLLAHGVQGRVVSFPSWELFRDQPAEYRDAVFPRSVTARLSLEAASTQGWSSWVGDAGIALGIDTFGASAPAAELAQHFGFTVENVVHHALQLVGKR
ncbi:MAG: transketolase [Chloroflexota bacterium]